MNTTMPDEREPPNLFTALKAVREFMDDPARECPLPPDIASAVRIAVAEAEASLTSRPVEPHTSAAPSPPLVKFDSLPLGARFKYPDGDHIFVKLEDGGCGLVAAWDGVFTLADSEEERATELVEWVDATPTQLAGAGNDT
jgi:hypothetical protein